MSRVGRLFRRIAQALFDPACPHGDWRAARCAGCRMDATIDGWAEPGDHRPDVRARIG